MKAGQQASRKEGKKVRLLNMVGHLKHHSSHALLDPAMSMSWLFGKAVKCCFSQSGKSGNSNKSDCCKAQNLVTELKQASPDLYFGQCQGGKREDGRQTYRVE